MKRNKHCHCFPVHEMGPSLEGHTQMGPLDAGDKVQSPQLCLSTLQYLLFSGDAKHSGWRGRACCLCNRMVRMACK